MANIDIVLSIFCVKRQYVEYVEYKEIMYRDSIEVVYRDSKYRWYIDGI